jgi:hypothetical protein
MGLNKYTVCNQKGQIGFDGRIQFVSPDILYPPAKPHIVTILGPKMPNILL